MNGHHSSAAGAGATGAGTALPPIHSYTNIQHSQHNHPNRSHSASTSSPPRSPTTLHSASSSGRPLSQPRSPSLPSSNIAAAHAALGPISAAPGATPAQPRNTKARACTNCKTKKIACRPGTVGGACAKCQRDGKRCIVEEPMPRPVRGKGTSKARVAEMEKKLDGLVALLTGAQSISAASANGVNISVGGNGQSSAPTMSDQEQAAIGLANLAPSLSRQYNSPGESSNANSSNDHPMPDINASMSRVRLAEQQGMNSNNGPCPLGEKMALDRSDPIDCENFNWIPPKEITNKPPLEDLVGRNVLTLEEADHFFGIFTEMLTHFPFYILPEGATVESMRRDKPVLLMAMLCTSTSSNKRVQMAIERDFRKVYSERVIGLGEKSLELLQAGLIYIAWFQCHFSPKTQIFSQMMHLFLSLVTDLGYDKRPERSAMFGSGPGGGGGGGGVDAASPRYSDNGSKSPGKTSSDDGKEFRSKEIRRAFLGTWWLTSSISIDFRKRIPMHYSTYMRKCQQTFVDNPEFESDKYMVMLLRMQKLHEDVCETFRYNDSELAGKMDLLRIQMSLKGFTSQMKEMENDIDSLDPNHPAMYTVRSTFYNMGMYVHEIGLHMTPPPAGTTPIAPSVSIEYTAERINILSECLMYTKRHLDFITQPSAVETNRNLTSPHWMRISYALIVLSKLSLGGTEPMDLCHIKVKTVIRSSTKEFTLTPHPAMAMEEPHKYHRKMRITEPRSPSPDSTRPSLGYVAAQSSGYDGWDTSIVRAAVKMEVYLDRLVDLCKALHTPPRPIRDEDRARYKANGVEESCPPDLYDFGGWMFGTMKEWYLAMVRREEEIEDAVKDAVSGTPGSGIAGGSGSSGTPGGSSVFDGSNRTRSTSVSVNTPAGSIRDEREREWATIMNTGIQPGLPVLKKRWEIEQGVSNSSPNGGMNPPGGNAGDPGQVVGGGSFAVINPGFVNVNPGAMAEGTPPSQMPIALPPTIGFDFMDTISDDFWGTMWSSWPQTNNYGAGM